MNEENDVFSETSPLLQGNNDTITDVNIVKGNINSIIHCFRTDFTLNYDNYGR